MVLIFGGTTEGRVAVEVCEQAGQPYYYSTRGREQRVELVHGIRLTGTMACEEMTAFCREHAIRLIVDAAHPFAESVHENILLAASATGADVVRFERINIPHTSDITWCRDYDDAIRQLVATGVKRLLMLTGVQTIGRMRPYWQEHACWCRILDRDDSRQLATAEGFPVSRLVYYEQAGTADLIGQIHPDAILTKESGMSGGLAEKIDAARAAGIRVFVVERPAYPPQLPVCSAVFPPSPDPSPSPYPSPHPAPQAVHIEVVNGPHGLRRAIETLLPDFFPLHTGLTTGTCATAAAVAATRHLLTGEKPVAVPIHLTNGETITVPVGFDGGDAYCIKDFSDDPDVTRGCRITARVSFSSMPDCGIRFLQGEGVGVVTLPGLGIPVGQPAINPVPRQMISDELRRLTAAALDVTISVEQGRELAQRTFNHRVGVEGGISIIGTSGIVSPLSNDAFIESIGRELQVARAMGCDAIGLASGKRGEEALLAQEPSLRVIHYGNFIGAALARAHELGFRRAVLGIMIGKAVKLAEGHLDTHSHKVLMNKAFLSDVAQRCGVSDASSILQGITMARELWALMPPAFFDAIRDCCTQQARTVFPNGELDIRIIQNE